MAHYDPKRYQEGAFGRFRWIAVGRLAYAARLTRKTGTSPQ